MRRFFHMLGWSIYAYRYGRNKPHGVRYKRWHAFVIAATGFHIGMGWIGAWTDPLTWIVWLGRRRLGIEERKG